MEISFRLRLLDRASALMAYCKCRATSANGCPIGINEPIIPSRRIRIPRDRIAVNINPCAAALLMTTIKKWKQLIAPITTRPRRDRIGASAACRAQNRCENPLRTRKAHWFFAIFFFSVIIPLNQLTERVHAQEKGFCCVPLETEEIIKDYHLAYQSRQASLIVLDESQRDFGKLELI